MSCTSSGETGWPVPAARPALNGAADELLSGYPGGALQGHFRRGALAIMST